MRHPIPRAALASVAAGALAVGAVIPATPAGATQPSATPAGARAAAKTAQVTGADRIRQTVGSLTPAAAQRASGIRAAATGPNGSVILEDLLPFSDQKQAVVFTVTNSGGQQTAFGPFLFLSATPSILLAPGAYTLVVSKAGGGPVATGVFTVAGNQDSTVDVGGSPTAPTVHQSADDLLGIPAGRVRLSFRNARTAAVTVTVAGQSFTVPPGSTSPDVDVAEPPVPSLPNEPGIQDYSGDPLTITVTQGGTTIYPAGVQGVYPNAYQAFDVIQGSGAVVQGAARTVLNGYQFAASDGGIFNFGATLYEGSEGGTPLNKPVVAGASSPNGAGIQYDMFASDGGVFTFPNDLSSFYFQGSLGNQHLNKPIVGGAETPVGFAGTTPTTGYYMVASDGGVFNFGNAAFHGSLGSTHLNAPIVGMAVTPDGGGFWLVASDGGVFNFGDAGFFGSQGGGPLNKPIVGIAATPDGLGYTLVASDGGIFTHGDAGFYGSEGGAHLNKPVVSIVPTEDGLGYTLVASDGGVFNFGSSQFYGSTGALHLNQPVVAAFP